ncbi:WD40 repeat domain-containing protein [Desulfocapsa sulfexigens]|nr:WD40 repeat domain-containing protein [Desulfocapsa sulfexigens]
MDTKHIRRMAVMKCETGHSCDDMTIHPSGRFLACTSEVHDKVFVFDIKKHQLIKTLVKDYKLFSSYLAYSTDGKYLIGQSQVVKGQHKLRVWDVGNNYSLYSDEMPLFPTGNRLYATPDNRLYSWHFLSLRGNKEPKIYFYTVPDMKQSGYLEAYENPEKVSISPDGKYMVDAWMDFGKIGVRGKKGDVHSYLRIWQYPEIVLKKQLKDVAFGPPASFAWTSDSSYFLYGSNATDKDVSYRIYHQSMKLFDVETHEIVETIGPMDTSPIMLGFLDNEQYVIALTNKRTLDIWDRKDGKRIDRYKFPKGWAFDGLQNPVNKNQIAYNHKDEIWIMEVHDLR